MNYFQSSTKPSVILATRTFFAIVVPNLESGCAHSTTAMTSGFDVAHYFCQWLTISSRLPILIDVEILSELRRAT